jgi:preprotein translocase subunit SecD
LPAITGFLLSTGMAVDANVLVFERIKEEMRKGAHLEDAIETGFSRAWNSIRDSNVATLVICFILWTFGRNFGASAVEGFAVTLAIGVFISMFTAVLVTRTLVRVFLGRGANRLQGRKWLLGIYQSPTGKSCDVVCLSHHREPPPLLHILRPCCWRLA